MGKLRSISRSQRFRLACSALVFFAALAQFTRSGSLWWGAAYVLAAVFLYMRPYSNALSALPLFLGILVMPFFLPSGLGMVAAGIFSATLALLFFVALGIKNLVLTNREALREGSAYCFAYIVFLFFFMQTVSALFWLIWLWAASSIFLAFCFLLRDYRRALLCTTFMGELIWVASWLPIGFLGIANFCFAVLLFMGDAVLENRLRARNAAIFIALLILISTSSYWSL